MLNTAHRASTRTTITDAETLTESDRWLILTVLTADPVELPTDVPDLSPLLDRLTAGRSN